MGVRLIAIVGAGVLTPEDGSDRRAPHMRTKRFEPLVIFTFRDVALLTFSLLMFLILALLFLLVSVE